MSKVIKTKSKLQPTIRFFNSSSSKCKRGGPMTREEQKVIKKDI